MDKQLRDEKVCKLTKIDKISTSKINIVRNISILFITIYIPFFITGNTLFAGERYSLQSDPIVNVYIPIVSRWTSGRFPLQADPNFSPSNLSPEMQLWHDREVRGYQGVQHINIRECSQKGDEYALGRCAGTGILALATATRVTGDVQFVQEIASMLTNMRNLLKDVWHPECEKFNHCTEQADGYLNFIWTADPNVSLYGSDTHEMDEMLTHAAIVAGVRALNANVSIHPEYQQEVDFWVEYIEDHFLKRWKARNGIDVNDETQYSTLFNRGLTHPDMSFVSFFYDMYRLTGKQVYLDEANRRADVFIDYTFREATSPGGKPVFVWRQRTGLSTPDDTLCQPVSYANFTLAYVNKLYQDGFREFAVDSYMQKFANGFIELVLPNTTVEQGLSPTVCGQHTFTFPEFQFDGSTWTSSKGFISLAWYGGFIALARWDDAGAIKNQFEAAYKLYEPNWSSPTADLYNPHGPAYMLFVLSSRDSTVTPSLSKIK